MKALKLAEVKPDKEVMVEEIRKVTKAAKQLMKSKLTPEAVELLIQHKCKLPLSAIRKVLSAAATLEETYIKKPESKGKK